VIKVDGRTIGNGGNRTDDPAGWSGLFAERTAGEGVEVCLGLVGATLRGARNEKLPNPKARTESRPTNRKLVSRLAIESQRFHSLTYGRCPYPHDATVPAASGPSVPGGYALALSARRFFNELFFEDAKEASGLPQPRADPPQ